jgi:hypothetical protein
MDTGMQREKWIDEVLNSTEEMHRAMPPDDLYDKFISRLKEPDQVRPISFPLKQWAAAAVLLLALNIGSVVYFVGRDRQNNSVNPIAAALEMNSTYNY